jgi:SAM-dependent methyltransferase
MGYDAGFASRYDRLVDWNARRKREEPFFRKVLSRGGVRSVLDCHCGTGFHCAMLSEMGCHVEGVDSSPDMLRVAAENLRARGIRARLHLGDVKEMRFGRQFDCAISMGNSLPHEFGDENLLRSLKSMYGAIRDGGLCVLHMENFDELYRDRDRFIPARLACHAGGGEAFIFAIDYEEDRAVFNILSIIEDGGGQQFNVDVVEYNPVPAGKMRGLLEDAGFRGIEQHSDFSMARTNTGRTYDVIFVAGK